MKAILFFLLIIFSNCYNEQDAIDYAKQYCQNPNSNYKVYKDDTANFISQCVIAGGESLDFCNNIDKYKSISQYYSLLGCLTNSLGWNYSSFRPSSFKAGHLVAIEETKFIGIVTEVNKDTITYCSHTTPKNVCNQILNTNDKILYYYK